MSLTLNFDVSPRPSLTSVDTNQYNTIIDVHTGLKTVIRGHEMVYCCFVLQHSLNCCGEEALGSNRDDVG